MYFKCEKWKLIIRQCSKLSEFPSLTAASVTVSIPIVSKCECQSVPYKCQNLNISLCFKEGCNTDILVQIEYRMLS